MNVGVAKSGINEQFNQSSTATSVDDDFGDFADAKATFTSSSKVTNSSDPLSKLINLDGLSKNPSKKMTMNQPVVVDAAAAQYQQDLQQGVQTSVVVSTGGSDAISSMMGPASQKQQRGSALSMNSQFSVGDSVGLSTNAQMQQQQYMMNQAMQGNNMGGNNQMQPGMMYGSQIGNGGGMSNMNINQMRMNQMQMNQMGAQKMSPQVGIQGGMNQMAGQQQMNPQMVMQGGINQMTGQHQMNHQMMGGVSMQGGMGGQQQMR
jgi:hypothetical protein